MKLTEDLMTEIQGNAYLAAYKLKALSWMIDSLSSCPHQIDHDIFIGMGELIKENADHTKRAAEILDNLNSITDDEFFMEKEKMMLERRLKFELSKSTKNK